MLKGISGDDPALHLTMAPTLYKEVIFRDDPLQPECHASTLAVVKDQVLVAWFGGEKVRFILTDVG